VSLLLPADLVGSELHLPADIIGQPDPLSQLLSQAEAEAADGAPPQPDTDAEGGADLLLPADVVEGADGLQAGSTPAAEASGRSGGGDDADGWPGVQRRRRSSADAAAAAEAAAAGSAFYEPVGFGLRRQVSGSSSGCGGLSSSAPSGGGWLAGDSPASSLALGDWPALPLEQGAGAAAAVAAAAAAVVGSPRGDADSAARRARQQPQGKLTRSGGSASSSRHSRKGSDDYGSTLVKGQGLAAMQQLQISPPLGAGTPPGPSGGSGSSTSSGAGGGGSGSSKQQQQRSPRQGSRLRPANVPLPGAHASTQASLGGPRLAAAATPAAGSQQAAQQHSPRSSGGGTAPPGSPERGGQAAGGGSAAAPAAAAAQAGGGGLAFGPCTLQLSAVAGPAAGRSFLLAPDVHEVKLFAPPPPPRATIVAAPPVSCLLTLPPATPAPASPPLPPSQRSTTH